MLPLLFAFSAFAAEPTPVLVSSLQARNDDSIGLAALVEAFLAQELKKHADIRVIRVEDTPEFADYPARTYMDGCPPGEIVGCTYVIGERGQASLAITGTVQALVGRTKVRIEILDIENARSLIDFQSELEGGSDEGFAEGVAKVLAAAIAGEIGQERDIRFEEGEEAPALLDDEAIARELRELSKETGGVSADIVRSNKLIRKSEYTLDDIAKDSETEAQKPWERLEMSPGEYLRYKNSGLQLFDWRERAVGRAGQLLIRPMIGWATGPYNGTYYGRFAYDLVGGNLAVVDAYTSQTVTAGSGLHAALDVGYGLTPVLDAGLWFGMTTGAWTVDINQLTVGQYETTPQPQYTTQTTLAGGVRVNATLFPVQRFRPAFGGSLYIERGTTVMDAESVGTNLAVFDPAVLVGGELFVGGEARVSKVVDIFVRVPLHFKLAGSGSIESRVGTQTVLNLTAPTEAGVVGAGVTAGVQIRLFGKKPKETDQFDDVDIDE